VTALKDIWNNKWITVWLVVFASWSFSQQPLRADDTSEATVLFERANRQLDRATRARGQNRQRLLNRALDNYLKCLRLVRSPNAIFNTALTLQELDQHREAYNYYSEYLAIETLSAEERQAGLSRRNELLPKVAVISLSSTPEGASIQLDDATSATIGKTPYRVAVEAGEHTVYFSYPDSQLAQRQVTAQLGEQVNVAVVLEPLSSPPPVEEVPLPPPAETEPETEPGTLLVDSQIPALLLIDGEEKGEGKRIKVALSPGNHRLRVQAEGYHPAEQAIALQQGESRMLTAYLSPSVAGESRFDDLPLVFLIATGVTLSVSTGLSIFALARNNEYESDPTQERFDAVEQSNLYADIGWVLTAAMGITTLVLTLLDHPVEQPPSSLVWVSRASPKHLQRAAAKRLGDL